MPNAGKETLQAHIRDDFDERKVGSQSMQPIEDVVQEDYMTSA